MNSNATHKENAMISSKPNPTTLPKYTIEQLRSAVEDVMDCHIRDASELVYYTGLPIARAEEVMKIINDFLYGS